MKETKLKVKLISYTKDPEQVVGAAIRQCYSKIGAEELLEKIASEKRDQLIKQVTSAGHTSTIEHANFTFAIEGISRACSHELVRHRIASYSQQSQRYVKPEEGFSFIVPFKIKAGKKLYQKFLKHMKNSNKLYSDLLKAGVPAEDARFVLPNATETKIIVTMNARGLFNFFQRRICLRAQWEIRQMALKMYQEVMKIAPNIFKHAGPTCETEGICWEGKRACEKAYKLGKIEIRERK